MENGNRLRLLYIYQHLLRYSDAERLFSTPELLRFLKEEHGMDVNRTILPGDFDIVSCRACQEDIEYYNKELREDKK